MFETIFNNPHYFMLGMIGVFVVVVIVVLYTAISGRKQPDAGDSPSPKDRRDKQK